MGHLHQSPSTGVGFRWGVTVYVLIMTEHLHSTTITFRYDVDVQSEILRSPVH